MVGRKIEVHNGTCVNALEVTSDGVTFGSLRGAVDKYSKYIGARSVDGAFVFVPKGIDAGQITVESVVDSDAATATVVVLEEGAKARICFSTTGNGSAIEERAITVGEGAELIIEEFVSAQLKLNSIVEQSANSAVNVVAVTLGNKRSALEYKTELLGAEANYKHSGLFATADEDHCKINVEVAHRVADCRSDVFVKGLATGCSKAEFAGLVYVAQDAQHTEAYQQSRNILLSRDARIITLPQLEIYADDVKCSHGATVGQLDAEAINYMRQRGLSEAQAQALQLEGFINDIVGRVAEENRQEEINAKIGAKLMLSNI